MKRLLLAKLIFSFLFLTITISSWGQLTNYTAANGPFGGALTKIISNSTGDLIGIRNGSQSVYKSTNGGTTWASSNNGLGSNFSTYDIYRDPVSNKVFLAGSGALYGSIDGGNNWTTIATGLTFTMQFFGKSATSGFYYAVSGNKLYQSSNGATTWSLKATLANNPSTPYVQDFEITSNGYIFIATNVGIYKSTNGGLGFSIIDSSTTPTLTDSNVFSVTSSGTDIYVSTLTGPFKSANNGTTWTSIKTTSLTSTFFANAVIEQDPSGNIYLFNSYDTKIWKTIDTGANWTLVNDPEPNNLFYQSYRAIFFQSSSVFFVGIDGVSLFKTADSGANWTAIRNGLTLTNFGDLFVTASLSNLIYSPGYPYGLYVSVDDGLNWDFLNSSYFISSVNNLMQVGSNVYASTSGGLFKAAESNLGTWTTVNASVYLPNKVAPFSSTIFYSFINGTPTSYIKKSIDAGVTWTDYAISGTPTTNNSIPHDDNFYVNAAGTIAYVLVYNQVNSKNEIYKIDLTTLPAAPVATLITTPSSNVNDIGFKNEILYAMGIDSKLQISSNGGTTWTSKDIPTAYDRLKIIDINTFYILEQSIYLSTDGGGSWVNTGTLSGSNFNDVEISSAKYAYVAANNSPVFKSNAAVVPPDAPTSLAVAGFSQSRVMMTWNDNSNNESYFIIEQSEGDNLHYDSIDYVTTPSNFIRPKEFRVVRPLKANTTYYYRVRAAGSGGKSAYTNEINAKTSPSCYLSSTIPDNRSWNAATLNESGVGVKTASNLSIKSSSPGIFLIQDVILGANTGLTPPNPAPPASFAMSIIENCGSVYLYPNSTTSPIYMSNGNGTWDPVLGKLTIHWQTGYRYGARSETTVFTLNASDPLPTSPSTVTLFNNSETEVGVTWVSGAFDKTYTVQRSTTSGSGFAIGTVNYPETYFADNTVTLGVTYYYKVISSNATGSALSASSEASIKVEKPMFRTVKIDDAGINTSTAWSAAWTDIDNDSFEDLAVGFQSATDASFPIYRNKGDGTFEKIKVTTSTAETATYNGIATGDYDNDGHLDLVVTTIAGASNSLLRNTGNNQFVATTLNVNPSGTTGYGATFVDFNNDGKLDVSYESGTANKKFNLYEQKGGSTFERYVLGELGSDLQSSYGASWADIDNDNDIDLMINDYNAAVEDKFYISNADGTFTKNSPADLITDASMYSITSSWGDYDNDGDLDFFTGNDNPLPALQDMLYKNNGNGTFTRQPTALPSELISQNVVANASTWGDIDNDGDLDLLVTRSAYSPATVMNTTIYLNSGTGTFTKYAKSEFLTATVTTKDNIPIILADYDHDGLLDCYVGVNNNLTRLPVFVLKNTNAPQNWLKLKLTGTVSNRAAMGARVKITLPGNKIQYRQILPITGFGSQNSLIVHFGLGSVTTVTNVEITWPSGIIQNLKNVNSNQTLLVPEDNTAPVISSLSPVNAGTGVAINTTLDVTFNEVPVGVTGKKVTITPTLPAGTAQTINATAGVVSGNKVTLTIPAALTNYTQYAVIIEAGAFSDIYGNPVNALTTGWTFTTIDNVPPAIAATDYPALVAKGSANSKFTATATDNVSVTSVVMSYRGAESTTSFADLSGVLNGTTGKWDFSILESYYNAKGLEFYVTAKDGDNNTTRLPLSAATPDVLQSLFEVESPVITLPSTNPSFPPLVIKDLGTKTFKIGVTDNFGVNSVVMSYRNKKDGITYTNVTGTLSGLGQYTFSIPETAFNGVGIEFYFTASDATGNTIRNPVGTATITMLLDILPPVFSTYTADPSLPKADKTFTVKVSDNLAVSSVVMKYRGIASKKFIPSSLGVKNATGEYEFKGVADWFDEMGIEYYFHAEDASKNVGVSPDTTVATSAKYYRTIIKYDNANPKTIDLISGSVGAIGYQIVSVPLELSNKNIADNFDELLPGDKTVFRFLRYHSAPTPGWDEFPGGGLSVINRGEGYFVNSLNEKRKITFLEGTAPQIDQSNPFQMALKKGWNQIGNPYTVPIQWSDVLSYNNNPAGVGKLFKFEGTTYNDGDAAGSIEPFKGGFVFAANDATVKIPFKDFTTGGRIQSATLDLGSENWEFRFAINQDEHEYVAGLIGMNKKASLSKDDFDSPMLPHFSDYIEASFDHPEYFMKKFSQDVVPTKEEHTWEFDVASSLSGEATLNWNNTSFGENNKEIYLMDLALQKVVNMREVSFYRFDPRESSKFKIFFGEDLEKKIKPSRVALSKIYPNPTNGITNISFAIPEQRSSAHVKLEVYDIMGKKMSTLANGNLLPGFYNAEWDVTQSSVADGLYICRLLVSSESGEEVLSEKIVVKK